MMKLVRENILRFIVVMLLQILLISNLNILGLCHPCLYLLFLCALPISIPRWAELVIGFVVGLIIDAFNNSLGAHTAACVLFCYLRPLMLKRMIQDVERVTDSIDGETMGRNIYAQYVIIMVLIHHFMLFSLLAFSFNNWWITLIQIFVSSVVTISLILGYDLIHKS